MNDSNKYMGVWSSKMKSLFILTGHQDFGGMFWEFSELSGIQGSAILFADHPRGRHWPHLRRSGKLSFYRLLMFDLTQPKMPQTQLLYGATPVWRLELMLIEDAWPSLAFLTLNHDTF